MTDERMGDELNWRAGRLPGQLPLSESLLDHHELDDDDEIKSKERRFEWETTTTTTTHRTFHKPILVQVFILNLLILLALTLKPNGKLRS